MYTQDPVDEAKCNATDIIYNHARCKVCEVCSVLSMGLSQQTVGGAHPY